MKYTDECKAIYNAVFGEEDNTFENALFYHCKDCLKYLVKNGEVVTILFLLPCEINKNKCYYLFAAATKEEERKKGYMTELLNSILKENEYQIFLRPANEGLIGYYEKFGFTKTLGVKKEKNPYIRPIGEFEKLVKAFDFKESDEEYPLMYLKNRAPSLEYAGFIHTME